MIRRFRNIILIASVAICIAMVSLASAQPAPQNGPDQNGQNGQQPQQPVQQQRPNVQVTKSYTFDGILFVLLMGGAIYTVCRSSQRR